MNLIQRWKAPKKKRPDPKRAPSFLRYVKKHRCVVCVKIGEMRDIHRDPHHLKHDLPRKDRGAMGMKPHDKWCVPLCRHHHDEAEAAAPPASFWDKYGINPHLIAEKLWRAWLYTTGGRRYRAEHGL